MRPGLPTHLGACHSPPTASSKALHARICGKQRIQWPGLAVRHGGLALAQANGGMVDRGTAARLPIAWCQPGHLADHCAPPQTLTVVFGAMPLTPMLLYWTPAMAPAQCVPCPTPSYTAAAPVFPVIALYPTRGCTLAFRSGWEPSSPGTGRGWPTQGTAINCTPGRRGLKGRQRPKWGVWQVCKLSTGENLVPGMSHGLLCKACLPGA